MNQRWIVFACGIVVASVALWRPSGTFAQVVPKANWIWFDEGDPAKSAPSETVYFRHSFKENYELAEAEMHITCDNEFVLYINGKEVGRGSEWQEGKVFNVNPFLVRGDNVIAVKATNQGSAAGLVAWLVRLTKPGNHYTELTDAGWKCTREAPENWKELNFNDSKWPAAKVLGELGKTGPWQGISWNGKADPGRFQVKEGFTIDLVAEPSLTGSIVNMTFDAKGRPVISRERGSLFILDEPDDKGVYRKAKEFTDKVKNCQGICCWDATTWYCIGEGPDGTGLYRLKDTDGDDEADSVELIHKFKAGMGEHGPHAVVAGPDGYLYINSGNHAWITATPELGSPGEPYFDLGHLANTPDADKEVEIAGKKLPLRDVLRQYEADLLARYEDANGHAVGIKVPGSSIWRLDPDGKHFTLEAAGFRNQYDFAFNSLGELFTFDSDMEWDEFLPWYRPVAVFHSPPGADHGWRSGSNVGPDYYVDNLPWAVATGRGSPCGVTFYNHTAFPPEYQDAFFISDWSYGRIFAVHLKRDGASFKGEAEEFVTGKPLNVVDVEVAPDGSLYLATGGRNTEGGVYRIRSNVQRPEPVDPLAPPRDLIAVAKAIEQPQPQSAWGRESIRLLKKEAGEQWGPVLESAAADPNSDTSRRVRALLCMMQFGPEPSTKLVQKLAKDKDAEIRAQAAVLMVRSASISRTGLIVLLSDPNAIVQRRALEGILRTQTNPPIDSLRPLLASKDRFVRYAARLALERIKPAQVRESLITNENPRVAIMALIAINKTGEIATAPKLAEAAFNAELKLLKSKLSPDDELDTLRAIELTLVNTQPASGGRQPSEGSRGENPEPGPELGRLTPAARLAAGAIGKLLLGQFPTGELPFDREISRLLAALQVPGGIEKILKEIEKIGVTESLDARANAIHYARCLVAMTEGWTPALRQRYLAWFDVSKGWTGGHSYAGYITNFLRDAVKQLSEQELLAVVQNADKFQRAATRAVAADERINDKADAAFLPALTALLEEGDKSPVPRGDVLLAMGRTGRAEAEASLLKVYDQSSGERDTVVRALASFQNARNWPIFVRALDSEDKETVRAAVRALSGIEQKPDGPAGYRAAIQAAGRLGEQGGWDSVVLLRQWSGKHFGHKRNEWKAELAKWQGWYQENYPDAPSAKLAEAAKPKHEWNYDQLLAFLEGDGRKGSVEAGRKLFEKAVCSKCHRLEQTGIGIGPDLTTLSSRFKRKDILESTIYPSRVISDQYKSWLIATKDGRVLTAMRAPDDGDNLVLLLSDATTLKLPKSDVDEMADGKQSVMPDGLLNELSLKEIADLFAFLESGKAVAPAANGTQK